MNRHGHTGRIGSRTGASVRVTTTTTTSSTTSSNSIMMFVIRSIDLSQILQGAEVGNGRKGHIKDDFLGGH